MQKQQTLTLTFMLSNLLKLSIPSLYVWLCGFYGTLQVGLNITAEVLRFGDRQFYLDWWNCKDIEQYWKLWNLPVYNWFIRHLYNPLLKRGFSKNKSNFVVFMVSGFLHEWVVSGGLGVIGYNAFIGIILQSPVIIIFRGLSDVLINIYI